MKILKVFFIFVLIFLSFYVSMNFYDKYDVNRDKKVDIKDLLRLQKHLIEESDK